MPRPCHQDSICQTHPRALTSTPHSLLQNKPRIIILASFSRSLMKIQEGDRFLMCSKKRPNNAASNYLVSMEAGDLDRNSRNFLGKLRANFVGTEFQACCVVLTTWPDLDEVVDSLHYCNSSSHLHCYQYLVLFIQQCLRLFFTQSPEDKEKQSQWLA